MTSFRTFSCGLFTLLFAVRSHGQAQIVTSPLTIISPAANTVVEPGQNVTVLVTRASSSGITDVALRGVDWSGVANGSDPLLFTVSIPPDAKAGSFELQAYDVTLKETPGVGITSPPLSLSIESPTKVVSLRTEFFVLPLRFVGATSSLTVAGLSADGVPIEVGGSSRVSFTSQNSDVASVGLSGMITATGPGKTVVTVRYVNPDGTAVTADVPVNVPTLIRGDLNGDHKVDVQDVSIVQSVLNTASSGPNYARDLNRDGKIDALDARILVTLCTYTECATHP